MQPTTRSQSPVAAYSALAAGAVLTVLSLTTMSWFSISAFGLSHDFDFNDLHSSTDSTVPALARAYFSWGAYALVAIALIAATAAHFVADESKKTVVAVGALAGVSGGMATIATVVWLHHAVTTASSNAAVSGDDLGSLIASAFKIDAGPWMAAVGLFALAVSSLLTQNSPTATTGTLGHGLPEFASVRSAAPVDQPVAVAPTFDPTPVRPYDPIYDQVEAIVKTWWSSGSTLDVLVRDIHEWSISGGVQEIEKTARDAALDRVNHYARMALTRVAEERAPGQRAYVAPVYVAPVEPVPAYAAYGYGPANGHQVPSGPYAP